MASSTKKSAAASSTLLQDLLGLGFLFLFLFTILSLCSYSSTDPSFFTSARGTAKNLGGVFGSHWSSLLWQVLGASSFMLATIFLLSSIGLFRRIGRNAWLLAGANFLLLLVSTAACFGLVKSPLQTGGTRFPMGGIFGELLGRFFESYLNTAGAALLTGCLLVLAISLCSKVSVRDLGLYAWLGISKVSVVIAGALTYFGMLVWQTASQAWSEMRPAIVEGIQNLWEQIGVVFQREKAEEKKPAKKEKKKKDEVAIITAPKLPGDEDTEEPVSMKKTKAGRPKLEEAEEEESQDDREELPERLGEGGPQIILNTAKATQLPLSFDPVDEMAAQAGEKPKAAPLMNLMKKAVRENEKAVKEASSCCGQ